MAKQLSEIWNYFTKSEKEPHKAICNICKKPVSFKTTITNLKSHLQRKHVAEGLSLFSNTSAEIGPNQPTSQSQQQSNEGNVHDNSSNQPGSSTSQNCEALEETSSTCTTRPSSSNFLPPPKRQKTLNFVEKKITPREKTLIDRDLLDLFILDFQPFSVVEDKGFSKFVNWIPGYELPSRKTISSVMIPALYYKKLNSMKETVLPEIESLCITTDCWTSSSNESYIAITGHYCTKQFHLKSILLKCAHFSGSHTAEKLASEIRQTLTEWSLEKKVIFAVSDNASNITKAIDTILGWKHYGCYAHSLNLIVQGALSDSNVQPTIEKIKRVVKYFKRSTTATEKLLKYQLTSGSTVSKQVIQNVSTRWNSTYFMLQRCTESQEAIKATLAITDNDLPVITNEEWKICEELCEALSPFEKMTRFMSGEQYMTGSLVIVVTKGVRGTCQKLLEKGGFSVPVITVIKNLQSGLNTRFENVEYSSTFALCTLLDPRFKDHLFEDSSALKRAKSRLQDLLVGMLKKQSSSKGTDEIENASSDLNTRQHTSESEYDPWKVIEEAMGDIRPKNDVLSRVIKETDSYLKEDVLPRLNEKGEKNCPLAWWKNHQHVYPNLAELFRTRCNVVATSVPCERIFSTAGNVIGEKRTRLASGKVEMLVFLNGNEERRHENAAVM